MEAQAKASENYAADPNVENANTPCQLMENDGKEIQETENVNSVYMKSRGPELVEMIATPLKKCGSCLRMV